MGLDIALLGGLVVTRDGEPVDVRAPKQRALLALLALEDGSSVPAERLIDSLWGATPPKTVAKNLQVLVGRLRSSLDQHRDVLQSTSDGYRIDVERCTIDIAGFERLVARGRAAVERSDWRTGSDDLRTALALWRGDSLGSLELEEWALPHVARLQDLRLAALEGALHADLELGRHLDVLAELEQSVVEHPGHERLRSLHMLALYRAGRQTDALESFHAARAALDDLGLEPGPDLRTLQRRILEHDPGLEVTDGTDARERADRRPRIFGRDETARELDAAIARSGRLVTVIGTAGVGKTTVARQAVVRWRDQFDDIHEVSLAPVEESILVPQTLASSLGIETTSSPLNAIVQVIGSRRILLYLDNFEHVLDAAPLVHEVLASCVSVRVLVTSRAALSLDEETVVPVTPLPVGVDASPAMQMFLDRASRADPEIRFDDRQLEAIGQLCERVDGLPLGIELAASRVSLLAPTEILDRLDERSDLLSADDQRFQRHRSLDRAVAWSVDLLDDRTRDVFVRLGCFRGGCDVDAVLAVCGSVPDSVVLNGIDQLVRHGLVHRSVTDEGRARIDMLETIARCARELLERSSLAADVGMAHLEYCIALASSSNSPIASRDARQRVRRELPNIRAALESAIEQSPAGAARLLAQLATFIITDGWFQESIAYLDRVAVHDALIDERSAADLQLLRGRVAHFVGDLGSARADLTKVCATFRELDDAEREAFAVSCLAELVFVEGECDEAERLYRSALEIAESIGDVWLRALATVGLANVSYQREQADAAEVSYRAALTLFEAVGDSYWTIAIGMNLGCVEYLRGNHERAIVEVLAAADQHEQIGNLALCAQSRSNVMRIMMELGRWSEATELGEVAVAGARATGDGLVLGHALAMLALCQYVEGRDDMARTTALEGAALGTRGALARFVEYPAFVLAQCELARGNREHAARWLGIACALESDGSTVEDLIVEGVDVLIRHLGAPDAVSDLKDACERALSLYGRGSYVRSTEARPRA